MKTTEKLGYLLSILSVLVVGMNFERSQTTSYLCYMSTSVFVTLQLFFIAAERVCAYVTRMDSKLLLTPASVFSFYYTGLHSSEGAEGLSVLVRMDLLHVRVCCAQP